MSSRKQVVTAGVIALVMALAIVIGAILLIPSTPVSGQGQLDILLTDPPTVPDGVTAVYVTYSSVAVHVSGAGNQSGWTSVGGTGTIDLMQLVNVSTTIAADKVTSGVYDALRFNISSAAVTFNGVNYTAFVPRAELTVIIPGGIQVNAMTSSAAMVDMQPTVLNIGSTSTPEFIVDTAASGFRIPGSVYTTNMDHQGFRMQLSNNQWWTRTSQQYTGSIDITSASLSSNSLSVTVENTGTGNVSLSSISVIPSGGECAYPATTSTTTSTATSTTYTLYGGPRDFHHRSPLCFAGTAFFTVFSNGTLGSFQSLLPGGFAPQSMHNFRPMNVFAEQGYVLAAGQSVTLTFSGPIAFGFSFGGRGSPMGQTPPGVISGNSYDITVMGQQALAHYEVVAS